MELDLDNLIHVPDEDLDLVFTAVQREIDRRAEVGNLKDRADFIAGRYEELVSGLPATEWEPGMVIGPGEKVVEDGVEYVNVSHAWLSASPKEYILGYQRTSPVVDPVALWIEGETITQAMLNNGPVLRNHLGVTYQAVQPHTTAAHWAPNLPGMTALWVEAVHPDSVGTRPVQPGRGV